MANKKIQTNVRSRFGTDTITCYGKISWCSSGTAEVSEDVFNSIVNNDDETIFAFGEQKEAGKEIVTPIATVDNSKLENKIVELTELNQVLSLKKENLELELVQVKKERDDFEKECVRLSEMLDKVTATPTTEIAQSTTVSEDDELKDRILKMKVAELTDFAKELDLPVAEYTGLKKEELTNYLLSKI